ncbi:M50 family metallopeptidase [Fodinicola acaciae]|uniref:M50 family metallopeptidase n=1 Tax=Fodinicola acaciae TaxID=2681555 RepID=UPI0013D7FF0C|nr:M50 family metallopeptidase [Fodinicola acaciae]
MWAYVLGVVLVAIGILISVCVHEAGHMLTAKMFGMKVTKYFVGFNPKLWSFHRGETEYGIGMLPFGGYCKISGMTPEEEEEMPENEKHRSFIRQPVWKRTIVLVTGSLTHFLIAFVLLWITVGVYGITVQQAPDKAPALVKSVATCVVVQNEVDSSGALRPCKAGDPASPAAAAGLKGGDRILSVNNVATPTYAAFQQALRSAPTTGPVPITYERAGKTVSSKVTLISAQRTPPGAKAGAPAQPTPTIGLYGNLDKTEYYGPIGSAGKAAQITGMVFTGTFAALGTIPQKVPNLIASLTGAHRDMNGPVSVVGVSRLGGEALESQGQQGLPLILSILASLNIFIGIFNLVPLLPMDGGHVVVAWFQRIRSWWANRRGRPDPGAVDYARLMPLTYAVVLVLLVFGVLTIAADIVNPIQIFQ